MSEKRTFGHAVRRSGTVVVLVSVMLVVIFGVMAVVLDCGVLRESHRRVQGASDAAAMAAATKLFVNYPEIVASNYTDRDPDGAGRIAALASAAANGFANDDVRSNVVVNIPPQSGPFTGWPGYAEAIITSNQKRVFSRVWGADDIPVIGRAVARGRWGGSGKGIIVLDPYAKCALNSVGTGSVLVTGGAAVIVNSNHSEAAVATGGSGITAASFEITGGYAGALHGTVNTGTPPSPDPLSYLPEPSIPPNGQMTTQHLAGGTTWNTLTPGRYTSMPNFTSSDTVILKQASTNSAGGIYYLENCGFKSTGATIVMDPYTSGGVMLYNQATGTALNQAIQITGNSTGTVNLSALTEGPYAGILFWQNRTATQQISIAGGGNFHLSGTFYAANAMLKITGNGDAVIGSQYISRNLDIGGGGNIWINYTNHGTARIREAILVE